MYAKDFEYDGHKLSDFGFIVCSFNGAGDVETVSAGSEITFNKVSHHQGKKQSLTSTKYERCIQSVFQICKNPCAGSKSIITDEEYRNIMRWLNRREFLPFKPIFSDEQKEDVYYNASFNVNKIMANGKLYGLELNMETDKPFGYGSLITEDWTVSTEKTGTGKTVRPTKQLPLMGLHRRLCHLCLKNMILLPISIMNFSESETVIATVKIKSPFHYRVI